jgi:hypothetical protein
MLINIGEKAITEMTTFSILVIATTIFEKTFHYDKSLQF